MIQRGLKAAAFPYAQSYYKMTHAHPCDTLALMMIAGPVLLMGPSTQAAGVQQYGSVWASSSCVSCNENIVAMQHLLVKFAKAIGYPTGGILDAPGADGKERGLVGQSTVAAVQAISTALKIPFFIPFTAEAIAKNADKIVTVLSAAKLPAPGSAPPVPQTGLPATNAAISTLDPNALAPGASTDADTGKKPKDKIPTAYVVGGLILFASVIAAGVILTKPK